MASLRVRQAISLNSLNSLNARAFVGTYLLRRLLSGIEPDIRLGKTGWRATASHRPSSVRRANSLNSLNSNRCTKSCCSRDESMSSSGVYPRTHVRYPSGLSPRILCRSRDAAKVQHTRIIALIDSKAQDHPHFSSPILRTTVVYRAYKHVLAIHSVI